MYVAKPKLQQALKIYQQLGDIIVRDSTNCLVGLAKIDYLSGKYQQARSQLSLASRTANYRIDDGRSKTLSGLIALELGNYHEALSQLRIGVHQLRGNGGRDRASRQELNLAQIALGEVYLHQGWYQQAEVYLNQALNVAYSPAERRRSLNSLGTVQLEIGQYDLAKESFERAAGVANTSGDRLGKAKTLENLGRIYQLQGDKRKALKQYQLALNDLRRVGAWSRQVYVLNNLGLLALDLGLSNRALEYFQTASGTLSSSGGVGRVIYLSQPRLFTMHSEKIRPRSRLSRKRLKLGE